MKKLYFSLLLLVMVGYAQPPADYYNGATGTGYALKTQLYNKIHTHTVLDYTPGLWNAYYTTDVRPDGKVWDIYSNCNFTFGTPANGGNQDIGTGGNVECQFYNREHTLAKSWFNSAAPMYTDLFNVMPTDKKDNGLRGNLPYGLVGTATYTTSNGSKIGNNIAAAAPTLTVFEPADEYKGDLARNYFYMATCYEDVIANWETNNSSGDAFLDGTNTKAFEQWALDMLYNWHIQDPVSTKEINRNNAVYALQGNRNPFIDHPEYVLAIWGSDISLAVRNFNLLNAATVYPNPSNSHSITIQTEIHLDAIQLLNLNGQLLQQIKKPIPTNKTYKVDKLPTGLYLLKLTADQQSATKKIIIQ